MVSMAVRSCFAEKSRMKSSSATRGLGWAYWWYSERYWGCIHGVMD